MREGVRLKPGVEENVETDAREEEWLDRWPNVGGSCERTQRLALPDREEAIEGDEDARRLSLSGGSGEVSTGGEEEPTARLEAKG